MDNIVKKIYQIIKENNEPLSLKNIYLKYEINYGLTDFEKYNADFRVIIRRHIYTYCTDRDLQTKETLFFPLYPKRQKGQKYGIIEWLKQSDSSFYNCPEIKTKYEWIKIIKNELDYNRKTNKGFISFLKYLYFSKDYSCNETLLAKKFHTNIGTINLYIKNFGKRVCKLMNLSEEKYYSKQSLYWIIPFKRIYYNNHFIYILRKELVEALDNFEFDEEEIKEKEIKKEITLVKWTYEKSLPLEVGKVKNRKADYVKANENKTKVGLVGETSIVNFEKNRLYDAGYKEYSNKVKQVSLKDDSLGYDILSYDIIDGKIEEIYIEVKTTVSKTPILEFYLTINEWQKFKKEKNYRIYYLYDIKDNPKLHIIDKTKFKDSFIQPVLYKVKVKVNENLE